MGYMGNKLYATEVASPIISGASTLVVDKRIEFKEGWNPEATSPIEVDK